ncbi:hypothetical protein [Acidisphaera rubrifaciens]|uniref:Uncharacterized protein n=1 Tax=Acidisphaera rubrifaciens HS-AP3 TaxID=1231350 RepID=A0A0D6P5T7_9PROT|nr:hypothetical protein [Acidisphaera rubrifaciens]GAN77042.1 hypothetical protein Asru_0220_18 [Acidisphaera rubrifaciens HS-AP3]
MTIRGSVDTVAFDRATGWIADVHGRPLAVEAILDNQIIGQAVASLPRLDLAGAGLASTDCGYEVAFYRHIDPCYLPFVSVRLAGSDLALPRTSLTGFIDVMAPLYARFPAAARYRTLLGGLWTDRSDSRAALDGRVAIGILRAELVPLLDSFIATGRLVLPGEGAGSSSGAGGWSDAGGGRRDLALLLARWLDEATLRLLAAVLEDQAVVILEGAAMAEPGFRQAGEGDLPSPTECLTLLMVGSGTSAVLETVGGAHMMPEFSQGGTSRWLMTGAEIGAQLATTHAARLEETVLAPGDLVVLAPGALYRLRPRHEPDRGGQDRLGQERGEAGSISVLRAHALPARLGSLRAGQGRSIVLDAPLGTRIWA